MTISEAKFKEVKKGSTVSRRNKAGRNLLVQNLIRVRCYEIR